MRSWLPTLGLAWRVPARLTAVKVLTCSRAQAFCCPHRSVTGEPSGSPLVWSGNALGPVESGVEAEPEGLTESRPRLAQPVWAMARVLDNALAG